MLGKKEIKSKIKGIKNTQKITKAMEMISASKMRKLKDKLLSTTPYYNNLIKIMNNIKSIDLEYKHRYFKKRTIKKVGYLVISTDRGLCGSLNTNIFKTVLKEVKKWQEKKVPNKLAIIGSKGLSFFKNLNFNIIAQIKNLGENPKISDLIGIIKVMINEYDQKKIDKLIIIGNKFINTMVQSPIVLNLLPITYNSKRNINENWNYIYEPNSTEILNLVLKRYIELQVYQNVIENIVSEQAARMVAMKLATDNGENLLKKLNLTYNKARQANITQEVNEIISGSSII